MVDKIAECNSNSVKSDPPTRNFETYLQLINLVGTTVETTVWATLWKEKKESSNFTAGRMKKLLRRKTDVREKVRVCVL